MIPHEILPTHGIDFLVTGVRAKHLVWGSLKRKAQMGRALKTPGAMMAEDHNSPLSPKTRFTCKGLGRSAEDEADRLLNLANNRDGTGDVRTGQGQAIDPRLRSLVGVGASGAGVS